MQRVVRAIAFVVVLLAAGAARADFARDVDALVRANIKAVAGGKLDAFDRTLSGGRVLVLPSGKTAISKGLVAELYGPKARRVAHAVESLHVVVDVGKKTAWFHGAFTATFTVDKKKVKQPMRVTGIVFDEGAPVGLKIEALMYARTITDKELSAHATAATRDQATTAGDAALAKLVAAWFDGGSIANDRSKNVAVVVNGTSPVELGNGAFAVKLVKAWDNMKMWAKTAEATTFANDEIAFVRADVLVPAGAQAAPVVLGAVFVKENGTWRWVALCFTPAA